MNNIIHLSVKTLRTAATLKGKIESLENKLVKLLGSTKTTKTPAPKKRNKMSRIGRARIAAAQKARWAKVRGKKLPVKPVKKTKRSMSPAARARISASAKARWKAAKAAGKSRL